MEPVNTPFLFSVLAECWKVKTAPKIQVFLWKSIKGDIAVSARLLTRGIKNYDGCLLCDAEEETVNHLLFLCPYARQVWAVANFPTPSGGFGDSIVGNFRYIFSLGRNEHLPSEVRRVFPWIVWLLWKNRNKMFFDGSLYPQDLLVRKAYEDSAAWFAAQSLNITESPSPIQHQNHWSPPLLSEVKCNIGFSWSKKQCLSGASSVVRDAMGNVLLHSRRSYAQVASIFEAKVRTWEWALESMHNLKFENVIFGASTHEIIQALHKPVK